ncbi:MAG: Uma2 family endonuclease [Spirulinaceae cyanobacterium]
MSNLSTPVLTDVWVETSWQDYLEAIAHPNLAKAKSYFHQGYMRIEMLPVGHDRAADNSLVDFVVQLYCTVKGIAFKGLANCSYRAAGERECQPDLSYYIREQAQAIPWGTAVVNLERFPPPNLAVEIAVSSLLDDQGNKRFLYEELGVAEYWVVDVQKAQISAYAIANCGSQHLTKSQVLTGLPIAIVEESLQRSREGDRATVGAWLLTQFQG